MDGEAVKKTVQIGMPISLVTTLVISALIWTFAGDIAELFGLGEESLNYCLAHIKTVVLIYIVLSTYIPLFGLYQGMGHSGFPTIVATCALGVRVCVTYLLRYSPFLGYQIIWWNGLFGFGVGFTITWMFYISDKWKTISYK